MAAQESSIGNLLQLIQLFSGKGNTTTTSGGTETKQTMLSQDVINGIVKQAMESNQGLASVANGERTAGLYNSTTNTMLTNDLISRLTIKAAEAGAPTVTQRPQTVQQITTPKLGASGMIGLGALSLGKGFIDEKLKGKKLSEVFEEMFGTGAEGTVDSGIAAGFEAQGADPEIGSSDLLSFDPAEFGAMSAAEAAVSGGFSGGLDSIGDIGDSFVPSDSDSSPDIDIDWEGFADQGADPEIDFSSSDCFLTTVVCKHQQKADTCHELQVLRRFRDSWMKDNRPEDIAQYYSEAPAIVEKLESKPVGFRNYIYDTMYRDYIQPAVQLIENGEDKAAYVLYRQLFHYCKAV